jgi:5'-phosphate synthase pdxT subunit
MIGVLALQGDFAAHVKAFGAIEVRTAKEIESLDQLILPGGESTAMLKLLEGSGIEEAVRRLLDRGGSLFGTCAGAILLAKEVVNPPQPSWGLIDITIERNAYGRQVDSFDSPLGPFIRAPRIRRVGPKVDVLETWQDEPVLVRQGGITVATFHPELSEQPRLPIGR